MAATLLKVTDEGPAVLATPLVPELDAVTSEQMAPHFRDLANKSAGRVVLLDLSHIAFIQSIGFGLLVEMNQLLHASGGRLIVFGLQPRVRTLMHVTRLDSVLTVASDVADAREAFGAGPT